MSYSWYYKDGDSVPTPNGSSIVKTQTNSNLRDNFLHFDPVNGITNAGHPDNVGVEENGSENFPFSDFTELLAQGVTSTIYYLLLAPTAILKPTTAINLTGSIWYFIADRKYFKFENVGVSTNKLFSGDIAGQGSPFSGFVNCIIAGFDGGISTGNSGQTPILFSSKLNQKLMVGSQSSGSPSSLNKGSVFIFQNDAIKVDRITSNTIYVNVVLPSIINGVGTSINSMVDGERPIFVNSEPQIIADFSDLSAFFDGGSIKVGAQLPYSIDTAILTKTEAQIVADIEALFDAEYGGSHTFSNLKIANATDTDPLPFVNKNKGNYLFDVNNSDSETLYNLGYGIGVGDGLDWDSNTIISNFVNSISEATTADGFGGDLYSRNVNADGSIDVAANDTVWVSKKKTLASFSNLEQTNFNGLLNSLDIGDQGELELYFAISAGSALEDVFNSTDYNFSYATGVLTIDFPRFNFGDAQQQVNKLSDIITNEIEKGSFDKDTGRILYSNSGIQYRIIIVKRGV